jgi:hypothetical protein
MRWIELNTSQTPIMLYRGELQYDRSRETCSGITSVNRFRFSVGRRSHAGIIYLFDRYRASDWRRLWRAKLARCAGADKDSEHCTAKIIATTPLPH